MKKSELNSMVKAEIKKIQKAIESSLINKLKTMSVKLGEGTDKLEKEIEKGSKKLAKKLSKEFKLDHLTITVTDPKVKADGTAEAKVEKKAGAKKAVSEKAKPATGKQAKETKAPKSKAAKPEKKKDTVTT
jgi:hypothetical protein